MYVQYYDIGCNAMSPETKPAINASKTPKSEQKV